MFVWVSRMVDRIVTPVPRIMSCVLKSSAALSRDIREKRPEGIVFASSSRRSMMVKRGESQTRSLRVANSCR